VGWQYSTSNGLLDIDEFDEGILLVGVAAKVAATAPTISVSSGRSVIKVLQAQLNLQCNAKLNCDGVVGPLTLKACPVVKQGANGKITGIIQTFLVINIDGDFGPKTTTAVKYFQTYNKLVSDGCVGANTWKLLLK
jgi:peptidoglycan hydrolase-like protein with peptidoglycan-binding domain